MTYTLSNSILQEEDYSREMPNLAPFAISVFITLFAGGFYLYDVFLRNKETQSKVEELEQTLHEVNARMEVHADTLHEQDQRIREKQDYDETDELHDGVYQAWKGFYERTNSETNEREFELNIQIWREKISTLRKNQEWVAWDSENDISCVVRDFYLGNSNPEFHWRFVELHSYTEGAIFNADTSDTFINGWDSTIKLSISVKAYSKDSLASFISEKSFEDDKTMNKVLKVCINEKRIRWSRVLIDV